MQGYDVFFLTGTDEHGKNWCLAGVSPKSMLTRFIAIKDICDLLNTTYDSLLEQLINIMKRLFKRF